MASLVIIPARNEAEAILETLESVWAQTSPPDRCVVVTNNCAPDDTTGEIARTGGAEVFDVGKCPDLKAGALNMAFNHYLPEMTDNDTVLVMDADTTLAPDFVEVATAHLDTDVGGVSSVFVGRESKTLLGTLQTMEFFRYKRQIHRFGDRAFVLSGTASLFNVGALRKVRQERGDTLPAGDGYYDVHSLTEDNELTLALLILGYRCPAPGVLSTTDVMESPRKLFHQRWRWYLGALRNLRAYGSTLPWHLRWVYWRQQAGLLISCIGLLLYIVLLGGSLIVQHHVSSSWIWLIPLGLLLVEREVTVWKMGWRERIIAATLVIEMVYSYFLLVIFMVAFKDFVRGRKGTWAQT